jgi:hypothetical protein
MYIHGVLQAYRIKPKKYTEDCLTEIHLFYAGMFYIANPQFGSSAKARHSTDC